MFPLRAPLLLLLLWRPSAPLWLREDTAVAEEEPDGSGQLFSLGWSDDEDTGEPPMSDMLRFRDDLLWDAETEAERSAHTPAMEMSPLSQREQATEDMTSAAADFAPREDGFSGAYGDGGSDGLPGGSGEWDPRKSAGLTQIKRKLSQEEAPQSQRQSYATDVFEESNGMDRVEQEDAKSRKIAEQGAEPPRQSAATSPEDLVLGVSAESSGPHKRMASSPVSESSPTNGTFESQKTGQGGLSRRGNQTNTHNRDQNQGTMHDRDVERGGSGRAQGQTSSEDGGGADAVVRTTIQPTEAQQGAEATAGLQSYGDSADSPVGVTEWMQPERDSVTIPQNTASNITAQSSNATQELRTAVSSSPGATTGTTAAPVGGTRRSPTQAPGYHEYARQLEINDYQAAAARVADRGKKDDGAASTPIGRVTTSGEGRRQSQDGDAGVKSGVGQSSDNDETSGAGARDNPSVVGSQGADGRAAAPDRCRTGTDQQPSHQQTAGKRQASPTNNTTADAADVVHVSHVRAASIKTDAYRGGEHAANSNGTGAWSSRPSKVSPTKHQDDAILASSGVGKSSEVIPQTPKRTSKDNAPDVFDSRSSTDSAHSLSTRAGRRATAVEGDTGAAGSERLPSPAALTASQCQRQCDHLLEGLRLHVDPPRLLAAAGSNTSLECRLPARPGLLAHLGWTFRRAGRTKVDCNLTPGPAKATRRCRHFKRETTQTYYVNQTQTVSR